MALYCANAAQILSIHLRVVGRVEVSDFTPLSRLTPVGIAVVSRRDCVN